jgi:galactose mutarotase-like enzyme
MITIENEQLKVAVNEKGAELSSIYNKDAKFDYIWNGDIWPKHAPVLFPAIGRSNEDSYLINGKTYEMPQHGFVSDYVFDVAEKTATSVTLKFADNAETFKFYPFHFELFITFSLQADKLDLNFEVKNLNDETLSFSLGSHPAFNVPLNAEGTFDDYKLTFETANDKIEYYDIVKTPNPYRSGKVNELATSKVVPLNHDMFEKGLIIVKNDLQGITLSSEKSAHSVHLTLDEFNYFTLWTKEGANADFLCLEPFYGMPDVAGDKRELATKEANYLLAAKETAKIGYTMTLK